MRYNFVPFYFLLTGLLYISCLNLNNNKTDQGSSLPKATDTSDIAIIPFEPNHPWPFKHDHKPTTLSNSEIEHIDSLLLRCISYTNKKLEQNIRTSDSIDFEKHQYKRQYIAVLNKNGQKEVWVNGFCNTWNTNWKTEIFLVKDGGNCYFNLKINLSTKECFEISVNGYA